MTTTGGESGSDEYLIFRRIRPGGADTHAPPSLTKLRRKPALKGLEHAIRREVAQDVPASPRGVPASPRADAVSRVIPLLAKAHEQVRALLVANIDVWGVYLRSQHWWKCLKELVGDDKLGRDATRLFRACAVKYAQRVRQRDARNGVVRIFVDLMPALDASEIATDAKQRPADAPLALTPRFKRALLQLARAMRVQLPALVTGNTGCGKTAVVLALAELANAELLQVYMTGETESQTLVGSFQPNGANIDWNDGVVTRAIKYGQWTLLDNLGDADPCVLERLNPCLEYPVDWRLVEMGDAEKIEDTKYPSMRHFRFIATMTTEEKGGGSGSDKDLSPALYNRFNIVHMEAVASDTNEVSAEIQQIIATVLGDATWDDANGADCIQAVTDICVELWTKRDKPPPGLVLAQPITFRSLVRLLDSAYRLKSTRDAPLANALKEAYAATIGGLYQVASATITESASAIVQPRFDEVVDRALGTYSADAPDDGPAERTLQILMDGQRKDMIVTISRRPYAKQVLLAVECSLPVLLEGPAAVGKTALISALSPLYAQEVARATGDAPNPGKLLRVNNTATTTIQDYVGALLPGSNGFEYQDGALVKAMQAGTWFLSDEVRTRAPFAPRYDSPTR